MTSRLIAKHTYMNDGSGFAVLEFIDYDTNRMFSATLNGKATEGFSVGGLYGFTHERMEGMEGTTPVVLAAPGNGGEKPDKNKERPTVAGQVLAAVLRRYNEEHDTHLEPKDAPEGVRKLADVIMAEFGEKGPQTAAEFEAAYAKYTNPSQGSANQGSGE